MKSDLYSAQSLKRVIKITTTLLICVFSALVLFIISYNCIILASRANINDKSATEYGKLGDTYLVQVKTDNWQSYYSKFSLLLVKEQSVNYEYLMDDNNKEALDRVYFIQTFDGEKNSYLVGKIESKVAEGVVLVGGKYVLYADIVGYVNENIPVVAIFNNELFLFFALLLIVAFVGIVLYFTSIDLGYDMMFENQVEKELKKDVTFGLKVGNKRSAKKDLTSEEIVEKLLAKIIVQKQKEDAIIPFENAIKALKVIDAKNFTTQEKVFVYFASLNLINRFIKQEDIPEEVKDNYYFKKFVGSAIDVLHDKKSNFISVFGDNKLIIVNCMGMDFSYHNVKTKNAYPYKEWSGLKLQPYANTIFELFYDKEFSTFEFNVQNKEIEKMIETIIEFEKVNKETESHSDTQN